jgi:inosine/xanthosine triphosphatase
MRIIVGSTNPVKIGAVAEIILEYPHLRGARVVGIEADSEVGAQPMSLEEIIRGARNRAKNAFNECTYGIGIESGFMDVPYAKTGYMDICACAIFDGHDYYVGLSSAFECPQQIVDAVKIGNMELAEACRKAGFVDHGNIGREHGIIHLLTKGRLTRKEFTKQALRHALIYLDI